MDEPHPLEGFHIPASHPLCQNGLIVSGGTSVDNEALFKTQFNIPLSGIIGLSFADWSPEYDLDEEEV